MMKKIYKIALIVDFNTSEYAQTLIDSLRDFFADEGLQLYVFTTHPLKNYIWKYDYQYQTPLSLITTGNFDGIIIVGGTYTGRIDKPDLSRFYKSFGEIPVISIGYPQHTCPSIVSDNCEGLSDLLKHLITKHKCKRFAFLGGPKSSTEAITRERIFRSTLKKYKLEFDEKNYIPCNFTYDDAFKSISDFYEKTAFVNLDVIVTANDEMALACLDFCNWKRIKVPDNIKITGFDNFTKAEKMHPSITTVDQNIYTQAKYAATYIRKIIEKKDVPLVTSVNSFAVLRQSTSCVPIRKMEINYIKTNGRKILKKQKKQQVDELLLSSITKQIHSISHSICDIEDEITLDRLIKGTGDSLIKNKIEAAAVCLYDEPFDNEVPQDILKRVPIPDKAKLICFYEKSDERNNFFVNEIIEFNPQKEMLPPEVVFTLGNEITVLPLFRSKTQYGYVLFKTTYYDPNIAEVLWSEYSKLIYAAYRNSV